jgi:hypothetical protein
LLFGLPAKEAGGEIQRDWSQKKQGENQQQPAAEVRVRWLRRLGSVCESAEPELPRTLLLAKPHGMQHADFI